MSVLVYTENWDGNFKKSTYEAVTYAAQVANKIGGTVTAVSIGNVEESKLAELGKYGADAVVNVSGDAFGQFSNETYAAAIAQIAKDKNASVIVVNGTWNGKSLSPRLSVKLDAGVITEVVDAPTNASPLTVRKKGFSGKAFIDTVSNTGVTVLQIATNAIGVAENNKSASIESASPSVEGAKLNHETYNKAAGKISLGEAEVVISGGRGLKGPENWGMVEELADLLGAGTACSKPVADIGWRPHHEHVGQTGVAVSPNLYVAIGISGAIQHLAGVSSSKVMVAINIDPEAPFFKAADYGIVGDAFDVVPKLIEEVKKFKSSN